MRIGKLLGALSAAALLSVPAYILARSGGAPPRHTGAPGDRDCTECHLGTAVNGGPGKVEMSFSNGLQYTPGATQIWIVTITDPDARARGFQVSSRPASNATSGQAGRFEPGQGAQVLCENDTTRNGSCPEAQPLEFITHSLPSSTNSFTFTWKAPDTNVGDVNVYVAGNAANNNFSNTGDRIYTASYTLKAPGATNLPAANAVVQVWDVGSEISSGTFLEIYGERLSTVTRQWLGTDFIGDRAPTELEGVRVNVNGKPAFVNYISPTQVNVQAPDDDATGPVNLELINASGTSNVVTVQRSKVSPALLTKPEFKVGGKQYVAALHPDFLVYVGRPDLIAGGAFRPAKPGDTIILFAVGCGPTNPAAAAGQVPSEIRPLALPFEVRFGETVATAQGYLVAQFLGLYQFNVTVPNLPEGDIAIDLRVDGVATGQTLFTTIGN